MRFFFRLPNGLTIENPHVIDSRENVKYLKEYTYDLLSTRYDMSKFNYYITLNHYILVNDNKQIRDLKCKSYDTIEIHVTEKYPLLL
jgi:hypothetical protein